MQGAHALSTVRKLLTGLLLKHSSLVFTDITLIIFKNHWGNLVYTNSSIYRRHPVLDMFQKALFNRMRHLKILHQVSCEENYWRRIRDSLSKICFYEYRYLLTIKPILLFKDVNCLRLSSYTSNRSIRYICLLSYTICKKQAYNN